MGWLHRIAGMLAVGFATLGCTIGYDTVLPRADAGADGAASLDGGGDAAQSGDAGRCALRCGPSGACCGAADECVVDRCLPPCDGSRCGGDDGLCCGVGQLCVGGECIDPGAPCARDAECAAGEICELVVGQCVPVPEDATCRYVPPSGVFEPELEWETPAQTVFQPAIAQLGDDDGDGRVDARDTPDVIAQTRFADAPGQLRLGAYSGDDGHELFRFDRPVCGGHPAVGDLDGDGTPEIVAITERTRAGGGGAPCETGYGQRLVVFDHTGATEWVSTAELQGDVATVAIAIGNVDGMPISASNGAEILVAGSLFDVTGAERWHVAELEAALDGRGLAPLLVDLDEDGTMEIVAAHAVFDAAGVVRWRRTDVARGNAAIARFFPDRPEPQIVSAGARSVLVLDALTGETLLGPASYPSNWELNPPAVGDFDGDGRPEIGVVGPAGYVVVDFDLPAPYVRWSLTDGGSAVPIGSTLFDFDADGAIEVVVSDMCFLRVHRGSDGAPLAIIPNTMFPASATYPVVADVDGDGNAEIVAPSAAIGNWEAECVPRGMGFTAPTAGVRVFRDRLDNWVATRRVWNQHGYHIDNVEDDGRIPMTEAAGWRSHNTYRVNRLPDEDAVTLSPDLVVVSLAADAAACPARLRMRARVQNAGSRGVHAGVPVAFFAGDAPDRARLLAVGTTPRALLSGESVWVEAEAASVELDEMHRLRFHAVADDDGTGRGLHSECDEENNGSSAVVADCSGPI